MPTKKISDDKQDRQKFCCSSDHNPPSMMVFEPGTYEHTCSSCGKKVVFTVNGTHCSNRQSDVIDYGPRGWGGW